MLQHGAWTNRPWLIANNKAAATLMQEQLPPFSAGDTCSDYISLKTNVMLSI